MRCGGHHRAKHNTAITSQSETNLRLESARSLKSLHKEQEAKEVNLLQPS